MLTNSEINLDRTLERKNYYVKKQEWKIHYNFTQLYFTFLFHLFYVCFIFSHMFTM